MTLLLIRAHLAVDAIETLQDVGYNAEDVTESARAEAHVKPVKMWDTAEEGFSNVQDFDTRWRVIKTNAPGKNAHRVLRGARIV